MNAWTKGLLGFIFFFGIIIGYVNETNYLSGYFELAALIKTGLLWGAIIGGLIAFRLKSFGTDQDSRFSIFAGTLVLGLILGPLLLSLCNRMIASELSTQEFELLKLDPIMKSHIGIIDGEEFEPDAHRITISDGEKEYEIQIAEDLKNYIIDDDSILLNIRKGGLGYRYVDHESLSGNPSMS